MKPPSQDELAAICIALARRSAKESQPLQSRSAWLADARTRGIASGMFPEGWRRSLSLESSESGTKDSR